jgi:hypothetical protein
MGGIYLGKESAAARWCQGIALTCVPYFALAILLHRFGKVTSPQAFWLIAFGFLLLVLCLALGFMAFVEHWYRGRTGGGATIGGVLLAAAMLVPYGWHGYLAVRYPVLNDIATNPDAPPQYQAIAQIRRLDAATANPFGEFGAGYLEAVAVAYPKLGGRRYNSGAERVYKAVAAIVRDRGWLLLDTRGLEPTEELLLVEEESEPALDRQKKEAQAGAKSAAAKDAKSPPKPGSGAKDGAKSAPKAAPKTETRKPEKIRPRDIEIEAVAASLLFGFANDIAIAILSEEESTIVDMRSSSRYGPHDFGSNERIIRRFLADLDRALGGAGGEG